MTVETMEGLSLRGLYVLPLWQPYASLMLGNGAKKHETRSFCPPPSIQGQRVAIHATLKGLKVEDMPDALVEILQRELSEDRLPHLDAAGAIIGTMVVKEWKRVVMPPEMLTDQDDIICGDWSPNRWVWRMVDPIRLEKPLHYRGEQGIKRFDAKRVR